MAIVSLTEMVVLKPAFNAVWSLGREDHRKRIDQLIARVERTASCAFCVALGTSLPSSWQHRPFPAHRAYHDDEVGKQRMPESRSYFYQGFNVTGVCSIACGGGWRAMNFARPLVRLKAMDNNAALLRRTLPSSVSAITYAAAGDVKGAVYSS